MALKEDIKGQQLLDLGKVKIASNKPANVFLLILETENKDENISVLYDRRHDYLDASRDFMRPMTDEDFRHDNRHIELDDDQKKQIIDFIESYEVNE